jgi:hypothetical protein
MLKFYHIQPKRALFIPFVFGFHVECNKAVISVSVARNGLRA